VGVIGKKVYRRSTGNETGACPSDILQYGRPGLQLPFRKQRPRLDPLGGSRKETGYARLDNFASSFCLQRSPRAASSRERLCPDPENMQGRTSHPFALPLSLALRLRIASLHLPLKGQGGCLSWKRPPAMVIHQQKRRRQREIFKTDEEIYMNRLASRLSSMNVIRKEHPLNNDELMHAVPGICSEDKHDSRSDRYTHIPTITVLDKLREEGFLPFFACQTRTHDEGKRGHTKHMMRLCRAGQIAGAEVPEIILLNSHDGSSNYQMIPDHDGNSF